MKYLISIFLLLTITSPAYAVFTAAEFIEVYQHMSGAFGQISLAIFPLDLVMRNTSAANHASVVPVCTNTTIMLNQVAQGYLLILGVNPAIIDQGTGNRDSVTFNNYEAKPRSQWVSEALADFAAAATTGAIVQGNINSALTIAGQNVDYYTQLNNMNTNIGTAIADLNAVRNDLTYANPYRGTPIGNIIGLHGIWVDGTNLQFNSFVEMIKVMTNWCGVVYNPTSVGDADWTYDPTCITTGCLNHAFGIKMQRALRLVDKFINVINAWALIPVNVQQCRLTDLHMTLRVNEHVTQSGSETSGVSRTPPYFYGTIEGGTYVWGEAASECSEEMCVLDTAGLSTRPNTESAYDLNVMAPWLRSWMYSDLSLANIMNFRSPPPLGDANSGLRQQAQFTNASHDVTMCVDSVAPSTVSIFYPIANQVVAGKFSVRVACQDDYICEHVNLKVNGVVVQTRKMQVEPMTFDFLINASTLNTGNNTLQAVGCDAAGNCTTGSSITVIK